tara:strand:- start:2248 stop:2529 length:282 start_codon:yes stop_codon:yes gene_type:complete
MNIDKVEKGEIVYCNIDFEYERTNYKFKKTFNKKLTKCIFARSYDCKSFPNLDVIKYSMLINKIDKKNAYYISKLKIVNLDILVRTGYIAKFD